MPTHNTTATPMSAATVAGVRQTEPAYASRPLKPFKSIAVIVTALGGILAFSWGSALREQAQMVEDFTRATRQQVHASREALTARLDALDQDTRMLTDLVEHSDAGKTPDTLTERRIWEGAFRALAVVVSQYRAIALVDAAGKIEVLASDPTETPDTVSALIPDTQRLAREVAAKNTKALGKTARYGERSFLLYGTPVRGGRAIVVASDAAIFLGAVGWTPLPAARLFVTDPAGVVWGGCETSGGCRATPAGVTDDQFEVEVPPTMRFSSRGARGRAVSSERPPAVRISDSIDRPTGTWVVTWVASTRGIIDQQRSMLSRVVLTALAAALAVAIIGALILRQQRKAVELEGRLRFAQALASARETSESIVENAPLGVLGVSKEGRVVLANSFLTERFGAIRIGAPLREAFSGSGAEWGDTLEPLLTDEAIAKSGGADRPGDPVAGHRLAAVPRAGGTGARPGVRRARLRAGRGSIGDPQPREPAGARREADHRRRAVGRHRPRDRQPAGGGARARRAGAARASAPGRAPKISG